MASSLTSEHFVGRVHELERLARTLADARAGRPSAVLLGGDSGVGKTRLIAEFQARLEPGSALVLRGDALEQGGAELPYAPLIGALRPLVRERHPALSGLSRASAVQLAALLPALAESARDPDPDDGYGQVRLFEALLELLDVLSDEVPVVLILEDMHWADRSTRTFVSFLARGLRQERVMVLITYRSDELHRRHPLRALLAELDRLEKVRRLELSPFDRDELAQATAGILGRPADARLVSRLFERAEGNPLFTEELLAAGADGRAAPPQSLRDVFMLRIETLPEPAQRAARAVSVGRSLDAPTIGSLIGIDGMALNSALRAAVDAQVLVAGPDGRFCFRPALLREALYDDLLPGERSELHLALAEAYEARTSAQMDPGIELVAAIANHYAAAGEQPAALRAAVQAALAAKAVHAYEDAADLAERALELWPRVTGAEELVPVDHVELLVLAAYTHSLAGDHGRAEALLARALEEVDATEDVRRHSGLLARRARVQWTLNRGPAALATAQRALAMLPDDEITHERASLLSWLARTRLLRGRVRDALSDARAALEVARAAGDRQAESETLNTLGMAQIILGPVQEGVASLRAALEVAAANDDVDGLGYAYSNLADSLSTAGRPGEALEVAYEGLARMPRRLRRNLDWLALTISSLTFTLGDWKTARDQLPPSSQLAGRHLIFREILEASLDLASGDEDAAATALEAVEPLVAQSSEPQWIGPYGSLLAELRIRNGDLPGARAAVAAALDRIELCTDDVMRIARLSAAGVTVEAAIAQRARDLGDKAQAREALQRARLHVGRLRAAAVEGGPVEAAWLANGEAELARVRARSEPGRWNQAAEAWEGLKSPYQAAIARWRAAEAYADTGERAEAGQSARRALSTALELPSAWLVEEVRALAGRARLKLEEIAAEEGWPQAPEDPFGLTERERQVLALLAAGATNRQIGSALYMAEKTASVHVSRILGKLGVHSRTQAAAVAHRMRLDRP